jgi:hypothetical protein
MSAHALRDETRIRLMAAMDEHKTLLAMRSDDTNEQMRVRQGIAQGIEMAIQILNETYREQNG